MTAIDPQVLAEALDAGAEPAIVPGVKEFRVRGVCVRGHWRLAGRSASLEPAACEILPDEVFCADGFGTVDIADPAGSYDYEGAIFRRYAVSPRGRFLRPGHNRFERDLVRHYRDGTAHPGDHPCEADPGEALAAAFGRLARAAVLRRAAGGRLRGVRFVALYAINRRREMN